MWVCVVSRDLSCPLDDHLLADSWREISLTKRDYTHFSCLHQLHTSINHIFSFYSFSVKGE